MAVELAVGMPLVMAMLAITFNLMVFLGDCARFDRAAAEIVRIRASSPAHGSYGLEHSHDMIERDLDALFTTQNGSLQPSVEAHPITSEDLSLSQQGGASFAILPRLEVYECTLTYRPWNFAGASFGVELPGITHTRTFIVDPFRPGVLL
jgi:hypothetical protein